MSDQQIYGSMNNTPTQQPIDTTDGNNQGGQPATGLPSVAMPQSVDQGSAGGSASPTPQQLTSQPIVDQNMLSAKHSSGSPMVAEDVDLIEKEWVNKAKAIVQQTKNDPSQQNIQLNRFKADYLKTRFSKDIKPMDS